LTFFVSEISLVTTKEHHRAVKCVLFKTRIGSF